MSFPRLTTVALAALLLSCLAVEPSPGRTGEIAKGADVGWLQQMVDPGQGGGPFQFYDSDGRQRDPDQATNCFKILRERHIDTIRFRVFVPPVTQPYWDNQLAGHCTIEEVAPVAAKAAALGLRILIDLHYSWTFADPGNQRLPVNWANEISGLSTADAIDKVASEVTAHTADVLAKLKAVGVTPEWVQVGNEITNGMLSEIQNNTNVAAVGTGFGSRSNMPSFVRFINAGYDAVKAADPNIKVIIHIDRAHNDGLDKGFFSSLKASGGKWDVSGTDVSGGLFSDIQYTVNDLAASFNTPGAGGDGVMMCEIEPPNEYGRNNNQFNPYPDFDFVTNILNIMRAIPNGKGVGAVYWEAQADPDWRGYQQSAFANHEPSPSLDAFLPSILRASGTNIIGGDGQPLQLRGVNLGGWLVMEPWMTPADSSGLPDEYGIIQKLDARFGVATEQSLINTYRQNWITTQDLDNIKARGLNVVRVPVWWGDFYPLSALGSPTAPALRADAFALLDWLVRQASERGIYTVIDMHGVFGGQSASASTGQANSNAYWASASNQANTQSMWAAIAAHFRGNAWVAGYDLLNEPDGAPSQQAALTQLNSLYAAVRAADPDHLIFLEGTFGHAYKAQWGWGALPSPSSQGWTNVAYEMHEYQYNATDANVQRGADNQVADFNGHKAAYDVPCYIGEFNDFGYGDAWGHSVGAFNADGMGWSSWSYKATHGPGPDSWGLYDPNGAWTTVPNIATDSERRDLRGLVEVDHGQHLQPQPAALGRPHRAAGDHQPHAGRRGERRGVCLHDHGHGLAHELRGDEPARGLVRQHGHRADLGHAAGERGQLQHRSERGHQRGRLRGDLAAGGHDHGKLPDHHQRERRRRGGGERVRLPDRGEKRPGELRRDRPARGFVDQQDHRTHLRHADGGRADERDAFGHQRHRHRHAGTGADGDCRRPRARAGDQQRDEREWHGGTGVQLPDHRQQRADRLQRGRLAGGSGRQLHQRPDLGHALGRGHLQGGTGREQCQRHGHGHPDAEHQQPAPAHPGDPHGSDRLRLGRPGGSALEPERQRHRYNVARSASSAGPFTNVGANLTTTSFSDTGLANGTTYYYIMSAGDAPATARLRRRWRVTTRALGRQRLERGRHRRGQPARQRGLTAAAPTRSPARAWTSGARPTRSSS